MNVRKLLNNLGIVAMTGALLFFVIRDARQTLRPTKQLHFKVPCEGEQSNYRKYETPVGVICAEIDLRDQIKRSLAAGETWEPHVVEQLNRLVKPGTVVVDVGAHMGAHTLRMARLVGKGGHVVAFEPQIKLYEELLVNLGLNDLTNVRAEFAALGREPGLVEMGPAPDVSEGMARIGTGGNRVQLRTLDTYGLTRVSVIKIDVEGFEYEVLEGSRATILREHPAILVEIKSFNRQKVARFFSEIDYDSVFLAGGDHLAYARTSALGAGKRAPDEARRED